MAAPTQHRAEASTKPMVESCFMGTWRSDLLWAAALILFIFAIYFPVLHGDFIWDDSVMVRDNKLLRSWHGLKDIWFSKKPVDYLPMTLSSFWVEWQLWGDKPGGYHIVNVLLHGIAAVLLWRVLRTLKVPGPLFAGFLFAAHPVCVASAAWISERKNTLSMIFYLLAIEFYFRSERVPETQKAEGRSKMFYALSLFAFVLAFCSKSSVVVLPAVLLVLIWWHRGTIARRDWWRTIPFFIFCFAWSLVTVWVQRRNSGDVPVQTESFLARTAAAGWSVWFYFWKAVLPINLSGCYPKWEINAASVLAWVPLLALAVLAFIFWKRRATWGKHALLILAYFVITLSPVMGFIDMYFLTYSRVADHWQYVSIIGIIAGFAAVGCRLADKLFQKLKIIPGVLLVLLLGFLTWNYSGVYASEETFWSDTLKKNPKAWMACNNLGNAVSAKGRVDEAMALFRRSLELNPNGHDAHNNLALALLKQKKVDEAAAHHAEAVRLQPKRPEFHFNLAIALAEKGDLAGAAAEYIEALRLRPGYAEAHSNFSNLLTKQGKYDEAMQHALIALQINPTLVQARVNVGNILSEQNKPAEAVPHYLEALRVEPNLADARFHLGVAFAMQNKFNEAEREFREVIRLKPDSADAQANLGNTLASEGRLEEAIAVFQQAIKLDPSEPQTHFNLAIAYWQSQNKPQAVAQLHEALKYKSDYLEAKRLLETFSASP